MATGPYNMRRWRRRKAPKHEIRVSCPECSGKRMACGECLVESLKYAKLHFGNDSSLVPYEERRVD